MELQEFIKNTLTSIVNGVNETNTTLGEQKQKFKFSMDDCKQINFDIAVSVSEEDKKSGGAGIKVYVLKINGEKQESIKQESVSRIQFKVTLNRTIS